MSETGPTTWEGGRIRYDADGRPTYQIREQRDGRRWSITLRARSEEEARVELSRFRDNPSLYAREVERRKHEGAALPVRLDDETRVTFLEWTLARGRTAEYVHDLKGYLLWWQERIGGIDLRSKGLSLARCKDALRGAKSEGHRIAAIKAFLGWLRSEGKIESSDDPTINGALRAPPPKPAKRDDKGDVPREHVAAVIERLGAGQGNLPIYSLMLHVQAGTGWHTTEVLRFMASGKIVALPRGQTETDEAAGVLVYTMQKGREHEEEERKVVSAGVLTVAKRLRLHGPFRVTEGVHKGEPGQPLRARVVRDAYDQSLARACKAVRVPVFTGAQMRHVNATAALNAGVDPALVSAWLGHKDKRTTRKFYQRHGAVPKPAGTLF